MTLASQLEDLVRRSDALGAWAWEPASADRTEREPRLRAYAGRVGREQATAGMHYLEMLLLSASQQGNLLESHGGQERFQSLKTVCVHGKDVSVVASRTRVAVSFRSGQAVDYWKVADDLLRVNAAEAGA